MKRIMIALGGLGLILALAVNGAAQIPTPVATGGYIVPVCGTAPTGYPSAGAIGVAIYDVNGNLCSGVTVSASISTAGLTVIAGTATSGIAGYPAMVVATANAPGPYAEGKVNYLSSDLNGALRVLATVDTTGLATSANQTTANTKLNGGLPAALGAGGGLKIDGSGTALPISGTVTVTGNAGLADGGTFTAGSTSDTPIAGFYESSPSTCTSGKACAIGLTTNREQKIAIPNAGAIASGAFASGSVSSGAFASGSIASGALASGSVASGAFASGSISSGAIASGAIASGAVAANAFAAGSVPNGAIPPLGSTTDDRCQTTDTTACGIVGLLKQNNYYLNTPVQASATDRSGTVTTGGTSQQLAASNGNRRCILITNPPDSTTQNIGSAEDLFVNLSSSASTSATGTSIVIAAGQQWSSCNPFPVTTEAINVTATTTAHHWVAKEF